MRSQSCHLAAGCFSFQELERSWREYDRVGAEVTLAKSSLLEQLEALGSPQVTPPPPLTVQPLHSHNAPVPTGVVPAPPQTEPPSQRHIHIQKELWRIQDVMEALAKNKPPRSSDSSEGL